MPTGTNGARHPNAPAEPDPFAAAPICAADRAPALPHNLIFEQSVLGGILLRPDLLREVGMSTADFYDPRHQRIWTAMADLDAAGDPIEEPALVARLERDGRLDAAGGLAYIAPLALRVPTADNVVHYASIVRDLAERRRLRLEASRIASEDLPADELRAQLAKLAAGPAAQRRARRAIDVLPDLIAEAALPMASTGFDHIDDLLGGGMAARTMTALIGPTGSGKTALAAQIGARHAEQAPVLFYSGELTAAQLVARIIAQQTGRSWRQILRLELDEQTMRAVLAPLNLHILGRSETPLDDVAGATRELVALGEGMPLVVIDYCQLIADVGENMRLSVMQAVRALHRLTESSDIVMVLLAQGSRASARLMREAGGSAEEYVDAGAETAQLEQAAANVISLLGSRPDGASEWDVTAAVAKARYGRTGKAGLRFAGASGRWTALDEAPATESEIARDLEIATIVVNHPADCERCAGRPLSASALSDPKRHRVSGKKQAILGSIRRLEVAGRIRNEGGALLPVSGTGR